LDQLESELGGVVGLFMPEIDSFKSFPFAAATNISLRNEFENKGDAAY
jgi:hypothetical protein